MADPQAQEKERRAALLAAALLLIYVDMREDVLNRVALGRLRRLFRPEWVDRVRLAATNHAKQTAAQVARSIDPNFDATRMDAYLEKTCDTWATTWGENVEDALTVDVQAAVTEVKERVEGELAKVIDRADTDAELITQRAANLSALEVAEASGATTKTWHNRDFAHPRHNNLEGVTVPIDARFPNGLRYPGAPGPPGEVLNCKCYLTFGG